METNISSVLSDTAETTAETLTEMTTNMPVIEVIEKAGLGIAGIFIVTGVIILTIWLLNRLTSNKKKDGEMPKDK